MAPQWGSNSIAPGQSAGWFFGRANTPGFLPVLQVMPLSPSFTDSSQLALTSGGNPYQNQLGISGVWSQLSDDLSTVSWFIAVQNNSNNTIEYRFWSPIRNHGKKMKAIHNEHGQVGNPGFRGKDVPATPKPHLPCTRLK